MIFNSIVWDVDPILIHFGDGGIRWYGLLWAVGLYVCWALNDRMYKRENCPAEWSDQLFFWMAAGTIIGARLGHCWFYEWNQYGEPWHLFGWEFTYRNPYIEHPLRLFRIWEGGLASHGGTLGIIITAILLNKYRFSRYPQFGTSWIWILDRLCIGAGLTGALIRLGNLFNSEIYGGPTDLPWGFIFDRNHETVPKHPTQIYESLSYFIIFGTCLWAYCRKKGALRSGSIFGWWLVALFGVRFLVEFVKNDQVDFEAGMALNMGQLLSLPFVVAGLVIAWMAHNNKFPQGPFPKGEKIIFKEQTKK